NRAGRAKSGVIAEKFLYFHALNVWRIEKFTIFAGSKSVSAQHRHHQSRQLSFNPPTFFSYEEA
ncbi:hypothetical protein, partial [Duncaniella muris]|uniref:hypothetical protein n=1 Tax=Duncaniella muris TaxID=2094150 RepID=UPI0027144DC1